MWGLKNCYKVMEKEKLIYQKHSPVKINTFYCITKMLNEIPG